VSERPPAQAQTIISAGVLLIGALGALGAIMQMQFSNTDRTIAQLRSDVTALGISVSASILEVHNELRSGVVSIAEFRQAEARFNSAVDRIKVMESLLQKGAHDPVEKATIDAILNALNKQIDLIVSQIADLNRQIAAALIIIDNNSANLKRSPQLPP
jgi:hypothetical protein